MMHMPKISFALLICLTFVQEGSLQLKTLNCYVCSTYSSIDAKMKEGCKDPFNKSSLHAVPCMGLNPRCLKFKGTSSNFTGIERACVAHASVDEGDECQYFVNNFEWELDIDFCGLCDADSCNRGHPGSLRSHNLQIILLAMATSFFIINEIFLTFR